MKTLFVLTCLALSSSAIAAPFVPGGECRLEGERKYVKTSATTADVYVCEAGAWKYLFTRDSADNQD